MTEAQAQEVVTILSSSFPAMWQRMSRADQLDTARVYRALLVDLDYERAKAATHTLIATARFMPTIGEIRAASLDVDERANGTRRTGMEAWERAMKAVSRFGFYRMEEGMASIDDEHILSTVRSIGWRVLCNVDETDPSVRARFIDSYNQLAARARKDAQASPGAHAPRLTMAPARQLEYPAQYEVSDADLIAMQAQAREMVAMIGGKK